MVLSAKGEIMSERTALALVFALSMGGLSVALVVLSLLGASSEQQALVFVLILCVAADTASRVVLHYHR
jgi:hypothetical protein